jgi:hypothetical protein
MRRAQAIRPSWLVPTLPALGVSLLCFSSLCVSAASAASPIRFSGELGGLVTDVSGKPQVGAVVLLFNKQDLLLQRSATDTVGSFAFGELLPDLYSVHISLSSFVPAIKERIQIKPGMRSLLEVNLSRVFSSVQLVSTSPVPGGLMNDNWKWALRADSATRPILRFLPVQQAPGTSSSEPASRAAVFTESRGLVKISAGDGGTISSDGEADLGTQFVFSTSVYGGNHLQVAGDVGYASGATAPSAAFRTTYSRELADGVKPEISVTMRQFFVPARVGQSQAGGSQNDGPLPVLRTIGVSFDDRAQISESLHLDYGFAFDNVSFLDSLHYFSPYGKLTYSVPRGGVDFTWTSGNARPELGTGLSGETGGDLQRDLASLAVLPRVTLVNDHAKVQRGDDFEVGFSQRFGSREYRVSGYRERVSDTTLTIASVEPGLFAGDLMPDLFSNSSLFNMGRFDNLGYTASVTQDLGDNYKVSVIYGSVGVISPRTDEMSIDTAEDLRKIMEVGHRQAVTLRASGNVKATGTRIVASYQFTDYRSATPGPIFSSQSERPEPGLNVLLRQPVPSIPRMPWRMEAYAELRNLLAQGYLPLTSSGGDKFLLINTPRCVRGGIAFVF